MKQSPDPSGFTLIEMAMVLVVLGLLLGGIMRPLALQTDNSQRKAANTELERINEALIGFVLVNGYLPCPDTDNDGRENRAGSRCAGEGVDQVWHGVLPWVDVGSGARDSWGARFTYAVSGPFTDSSQAPLPAFGLESAGLIEVVDGIDRTPALVLSHGENSRGALSTGGTRRSPPDGTFERENSNGDRRFHRGGFNNGPDQPYDDQMTWISPYILKNRLQMAGRLGGR